MAQRKQLTWEELRVGVFVLLGLVVLGMAIFYVTGAGSLGPKYRLRTFLGEVEGLTKGAPVRLDGIEAGNVEAIRINPHPASKAGSIEVDMRVKRQFEPYIRSDSRATLITEGLLGNRYVSISRGSAGSPIPSGGTVPAEQKAAIEDVVQRGAEIAQNLGVLSEDVQDIVKNVKAGKGTLGKLLTEDTLYNRINGTAGRIEAIVASTQAGNGTIGKLVASDAFYNKADAALGDAADILSSVRQQKGTLGKFVYDPAVYQDARQFLSRGNDLLDGVQQGKGTLGKLVTDDALYANLRDAASNLKSATGKLNNGQGTMGRFFTDPQLYDNMTGLTADLRAFIAQIQKNPRKYLRVKFSVF